MSFSDDDDDEEERFLSTKDPSDQNDEMMINVHSSDTFLSFSTFISFIGRDTVKKSEKDREKR